MTWTTLLAILLAAFAGGALSTAVAETMRGWVSRRRRRRVLLFMLGEELVAWQAGRNDWMAEEEGQRRAQGSIEIRTLQQILDADLFGGDKEREFRAKALEVQRVVSIYNKKFEVALLIQAQNAAQGSNARFDAARYAGVVVIPRLKELAQDAERLKQASE